MAFSPLRYCEKCGQIKREDFMRSESECLGCHYDSIEKAKESESQKKQIGRKHAGAAPKGAAGLGEKEKAQPRGQARLIFIWDSRATGIRLSRGKGEETS